MAYTAIYPHHRVSYPQVRPLKFEGLARIDETAPEPVTLAEVKLDRRAIPDTAEDSLLTELIAVARRHLEDYTHRALKPLTIRVHYPCFGSALEVPLPPLNAVDSISYRAPDNSLEILPPDQYRLETSITPGVIIPEYNVTWPDTLNAGLPVILEAQVGYDPIPEPLKKAILMFVGHLYENREITSPLNIREVPVTMALAESYRLFRA